MNFNNTQIIEKNKIKPEYLDVTPIESEPIKNCEKCKKKNKPGCKFCKKSKKKFSWVLFWGLYFLFFAIWGHIELFKLLKTLF